MRLIKHELGDLINMLTEPNCLLCGHITIAHITFETRHNITEPVWFKPCAWYINNRSRRPCGCLRYIDCLYEEE